MVAAVRRASTRAWRPPGGTDRGPAAADRDAARRRGPWRSPSWPSPSATRGVAGFDIAGAEAGFPPTRHLDAFEYLQRENAHFTIHAGEAFGLPSIWEAIQWCGADRLGHGVRIIDDITVDDDGSVELGRLAAYVRDKRIPLEMCPASNMQTGAARRRSPSTRSGCCTRLRFRVTVNTDNRLMSGTSMTARCRALVEAFGYGLEDLRWFTINAMKSAFLPVRRAARRSSTTSSSPATPPCRGTATGLGHDRRPARCQRPNGSWASVKSPRVIVRTPPVDGVIDHA